MKKYNVRFIATDAAVKQILKRAALVNLDCRNPGPDSFSSSLSDLTVCCAKISKMLSLQWTEKVAKAMRIERNR